MAGDAALHFCRPSRDLQRPQMSGLFAGPDDTDEISRPAKAPREESAKIA
jgi:hypothetical protein